MLIVHKIMDTLVGNPSGYKLMVAPGTPKEFPTLLYKSLYISEKFDFGTLHLEKRAPEPGLHPGAATFVAPELTFDEMLFWSEGFVPLPARFCWFEYTLGNRSGLLVSKGGFRNAVKKEDAGVFVGDLDEAIANGLVDNKGYSEDTWVIIRMDLIDNTIVIDGITCAVDPQKVNALTPEIHVEFGGNKEWADNFMANDPILARGNAANAYLAIYFTLMLNSKTTEVFEEKTSPKLAKAQMKRGKTPLPDHRIVTIVPKQFLRGEHGGDGTGTHKRLHWRRSHKRHFDHNTPGSQWAENELWNGKRGWWVTVIPRFLVGRAELGEVTHEYRVLGDTDV